MWVWGLWGTSRLSGHSTSFLSPHLGLLPLVAWLAPSLLRSFAHIHFTPRSNFSFSLHPFLPVCSHPPSQLSHFVRSQPIELMTDDELNDQGEWLWVPDEAGKCHEYAQGRHGVGTYE